MLGVAVLLGQAEWLLEHAVTVDLLYEVLRLSEVEVRKLWRLELHELHGGHLGNLPVGKKLLLMLTLQENALVVIHEFVIALRLEQVLVHHCVDTVCVVAVVQLAWLLRLGKGRSWWDLGEHLVLLGRRIVVGATHLDGAAGPANVGFAVDDRLDLRHYLSWHVVLI